jgi:hemerythrin-like metal-binding protein
MNTASRNIVAWSNAYDLGLPEIDSQHRTLFDLLNRAWEAIVARADAKVMLEILQDLERYTLSHFAAEETFMRVMNYPQFAEHKKSHDAFSARIEFERRAIEAGAANISLELVRFLKDWLVDHILVADKAYAESLKRRKQPPSLLGRFFRRFAR